MEINFMNLNSKMVITFIETFCFKNDNFQTKFKNTVQEISQKVPNSKLTGVKYFVVEYQCQ